MEIKREGVTGEGIQSLPLPPAPESEEGALPLPQTPSHINTDNELVSMFTNEILSDIDNAKTILLFGKRNCGKTYDTNIISNLFQQYNFRVHSVLTISGKISGCPHIADIKGAYLHCLLDVRQQNIRSCIIIDEVDTMAKTHSMDDDIRKIINVGRHLKIWAVWNARRPARVNMDLTSLADVIIVHYLSSEKDIRYLEDITDEQFAERVREMKRKIELNEISKYSRVIFA